MKKEKITLLNVEDPKGEIKGRINDVKSKTGILSKKLIAIAIVKGLDVIEREWHNFQVVAK